MRDVMSISPIRNKPEALPEVLLSLWSVRPVLAERVEVGDGHNIDPDREARRERHYIYI